MMIDMIDDILFWCIGGVRTGVSVECGLVDLWSVDWCNGGVCTDGSVDWWIGGVRTGGSVECGLVDWWTCGSVECGLVDRWSVDW